MNLTTLTHRDALCLNVRFTSREEAIHALTQRLAALGKFPVTEQFLERSVLAVKASARPP